MDEPKPRKKPRKVTARSLENVALHYLKRYASTEAQLKRVLVRRVRRSLRIHGGDEVEVLGWVDACVARCARNGLVNDRSYAESRAESLRRSGRSTRVIAQKLKLKGVPADLVKANVLAASEALSDEAAARIHARKKRLGPFRRDLSTRKEHRQKDLASLARAGFSFATARNVIDGSAE